MTSDNLDEPSLYQPILIHTYKKTSVLTAMRIDNPLKPPLRMFNKLKNSLNPNTLSIVQTLSSMASNTSLSRKCNVSRLVKKMLNALDKGTMWECNFENGLHLNQQRD
ncbi:hypothetical protein BY996DRAFT_6416974 [Phakopsora pachyrhizi]|nr:hypothetical protein BY996DRAFT_6416974 [Phakopsora pachyrhizi]